MTWPSDSHDEVVGQHRGQLGDREDEDEVEEQLERGDALHRRWAVASTVPVTAASLASRLRGPDAATLRRRAEPRDPLLADGHGRRARARGAGDPGRRPLPGAPARARAALPRPHQQLDLHPPRPGGAPARQRPRGARGGDLHLGAGHRRLPARPAPGRLGLRHRRGGADHRDARGRLHADRARPRLRRPRRDAHLQLRAHHAGDPPDRQRRALHRHQPRCDGPVERGAAARPPARWRR